MSSRRFTLPPWARIGLALSLIFGVALFLRCYFPYDNVFGGDYVRFQIVDPWYHMRLVENLVQHFPLQNAFDPYTSYPHGQDIFFAPFYDLLLGFVVWVVGLGSPSQQVIETVGAYFPAVLGALVTLPVYFMGREFFNKTVGLLAAALVAILPGEFLLRSLLGFTDHHIGEALFSAVAVLFLILALKRAKRDELTFHSVWRRDWKALQTPLVYSLLGGLALGCYFLTWVGSLLFVFILFAFVVVQSIIDHVKGRSTDYLCIVGVPALLISLLMLLPFLDRLAFGTIQVIAVLIAAAAFPALSGLSHLLDWRGIRRAYYPLALLGLGAIGVGLFYLVARDLLASMVALFDIFVPSGGLLTIVEAQPLLYLTGTFSLGPAWAHFTTGFFLALVSLVLVAYAVVKEGGADKTLLLIWSVIVLAATLGQNRFGYYYAVNVAILSAYLCWRTPGWIASTLSWLGFQESSFSRKGTARSDKRRKAKDDKKKKKKGKKQESQGVLSRYLTPRYVSLSLGVVLVALLVYAPNIPYAVDTASEQRGPGQDWHDSLVWMRENTPDPFQDPAFYYGIYQVPAAGEDYDYPESAYGVMSWWDYGHWITYIAHRIPNTNPHQSGAVAAAQFLTAADEPSANAILDSLGSKYVVIDSTMPMYIESEGRLIGKFYAIITWTGEDMAQFFELHYIPQPDGSYKPMLLYYPRYYQSMAVRLYYFGGDVVVPASSTWVVSYQEAVDDDGNIVKVSEFENDGQPFATYQEAEQYIDDEGSSNLLIVGKNPYISPVPLERLEHYEHLYSSDTTVIRAGDREISYIEIFEYRP